MKKPKRKLTAAQKRARRERRKKFMTIFIGGKQKRVPRPQLIEGLTVDEFIRQNADPIWLHQNEMWELIEPVPASDYLNEQIGDSNSPMVARPDSPGEIPF